VDLFQYSPKENKLKFLHSFTHTLFRNLNDVAGIILPIGKKGMELGFYTTNWLRYDTGTVLNLIELLTERAWSDVVFCRAQFSLDRQDLLTSFSCHPAVPSGNIVGANGVGISEDQKTVFVMAGGSKMLHIYNRDPQTNSLKLHKMVYLTTHCDNPHIGPKGEIYSACHSNVLLFMKHKVAGSPSPTQLVKISEKEDGTREVRELLFSEGKDLSGASIATVYEPSSSESGSNPLLIAGAVFDNGLLVCPLESHSQGRVLFELSA